MKNERNLLFCWTMKSLKHCICHQWFRPIQVLYLCRVMQFTRPHLRLKKITWRWFSVTMYLKRKLNYRINFSVSIFFFCKLHQICVIYLIFRVARKSWRLFLRMHCMLLVPLVSLLLSSRLDQITVSLYNISVLPRRQAGRITKVIKWEKLSWYTYLCVPPKSRNSH